MKNHSPMEIEKTLNHVPDPSVMGGDAVNDDKDSGTKSISGMPNSGLVDISDTIKHND